MGALRRLARSLVRGDAEADDLVQETMLVALQKAPEDASRPLAWLYGVARNVARNLRRGDRRRGARERRGARPESEPPGDHVAARLEEQRGVLAFARDLAEPYRTAVYCRYFEDLSPKEIAVRLGLPVATVKTHLRRGLEQLRSRLDDRHGGDRAAWQVLLIPLTTEAGPAPRAQLVPASVLGLAASALAATVVGYVVLGPSAGEEERGSRASVDTAALDLAERTAVGDAAGRLDPRGDGASREQPASGPASADPGLRIHVSFAEVGSPVPTTVHLRNEARRTWTRPVSEDGTAAFPEVPPGHYVAWAVTKGSATAAARTFELPRDDPDPIWLAIVPAATLTGRVLEEGTDAVVADATVEVLGARGSEFGSPVWSGATDATGAFTLESVPAASSGLIPALQITALAPGFAVSRAPLAFPGPKGGAPWHVDLRVRRGCGVTGRCLDADGRPLAGATVHAFAAPAPDAGGDAHPRTGLEPVAWSRRVVVGGRTQAAPEEASDTPDLLDTRPPPLLTGVDDGGRFVLTGLVPGTRYGLLATHPDRPESDVVQFVAADGADPVVLQFVRFATLWIRVVDTQGRPIPEARLLRLRHERPAPGEFLLPRIVAGPTHLRVEADGFVSQMRWVVLAPGEDQSLDLPLKADVPAVGFVRDPAGRPLAGAKVGFMYGKGPGNFEPAGRMDTTTDGEGRFTLRGIPAGSFKIYCHHAGHMSQWPEVQTPGPPISIVLEPKTQRFLSIHLQPPPGAAMPESFQLGLVYPGWRDEPGRGEDLRRWVAGLPGPGRGPANVTRETSPAVRELQDGHRDFVVLTDDYPAAWFTAATAGDVVVPLVRGVTISGILVGPDGSPIAGGAVALDSFVFDDCVVRTDASGAFRLERVPEGVVRLLAYAPGHSVVVVDRRAERDGPPLRIELARGVLLTGTLLGYGAEGVAGGAPVEVRAADGPEGAPPLDLVWAPEETWRYSIELPPGRYRLTARNRDRVGEVVVDLTDGQTTSADITLRVDGKEGAR